MHFYQITCHQRYAIILSITKVNLGIAYFDLFLLIYNFLHLNNLYLV